MANLMERLTEAATAAIRNEGPSLRHEPERIRGVVLELSVASNGTIGEGSLYVERRVPQRVGRAAVPARSAD